MERYFNVTGACKPERHYMVDIQKRLGEIKQLVDFGAYFTINRGRQYGKTTTLRALAEYLKKDYVVISLDFQMMSSADFENERTFANSFADIFISTVERDEAAKDVLTSESFEKLIRVADSESLSGLRKLFIHLNSICASASKPLVLMIDEVDSASNHQVFLDFLAQLRAYYLSREEMPTFQSVILASVYDIKNIRQKIRPNIEHKINSPWNIATDFEVMMSLSEDGIAGMLQEYENDYHTGMNIDEMSALIYSYTSGYPFLVSRICKLIDEKITGKDDFPDKAAAWTKKGFLEAIKMILMESNTLFESLMGRLQNEPDLQRVIYAILFRGEKILYSPDNLSVSRAMMFGFVKKDAGAVVIANRIFEMRIYNYFLSAEETRESELCEYASDNKNQFIHNGYLDMTQVLKKFVEHFDSIYGDAQEEFDEEEGRRRFLLYLRPIINGTGNYYIEAETRNARRMDVVVDYSEEQFIIELKIWRGNAYHERGEQQLADYLNYFHLQKGYMLSYNFNQKKEIGVKEISIGDRVLVEAVV